MSFIAYTGYAQRFVTGTITSKDEGVLPGVNVLLKGSRTGVATDNTGSFKISVPDDNAVLVFSFIGYSVQEVPVERVPLSMWNFYLTSKHFKR
ncbi:MAG: carboxypeptidase-like regulatory domain-containing protein [Spirosomataceae bacterium]